MKKFILLFLAMLVFIPISHSADQWEIAAVTGSTDPTDLDIILNQQFSAQDRMLRNYRRKMIVSPDTSSQIEVSEGEIMVCNSGATDCEMRQTTSSTTVTWADLDTGSESSGVATQYYVYATADTDITGVVFKLSTNSTAPSGHTQYRKIGYFNNNASDNIVFVGNIKGSGIPNNVVKVTDQSDYSTSSTSYADISGMSVEFVSSGGPIRVDFRSNCRNNAGNGSMTYFTVDISGTDYGDQVAGEGTNTADGHNQANTVAFSEVIEDPGSGVLTIKMQWKVVSGTASLGASSANPDFDNTLIVTEL